MLQAAVLSDSHGFLDEMLKVMREIGLIDAKGRWIGGSTRLVHLGDMLDRGPDPIALYMYLRELYDQLGPEQVSILMGNHELQYLDGPDCGGVKRDANGKNISDKIVDEDFLRLLKADALAGRLSFAASIQDGSGKDWLCVHGGLHPQYKDLTQAPIDETVARLNQLGLEFVRDGVDHPEIVGVGYQRAPQYNISLLVHNMIEDAKLPANMKKQLQSRHPLTALRNLEEQGLGDPQYTTEMFAQEYGIYEAPGITWCDVNDDLTANADKARPQIVGHRQQSRVQLVQDTIWATNVAYGDAQALVVNDEGHFQTSDLYRGGPEFFMDEPGSYSNPRGVDLDAIRQKAESGWELTETEQEYLRSQDL